MEIGVHTATCYPYESNYAIAGATASPNPAAVDYHSYGQPSYQPNPDPNGNYMNSFGSGYGAAATSYPSESGICKICMTQRQNAISVWEHIFCFLKSFVSSCILQFEKKSQIKSSFKKYISILMLCDLSLQVHSTVQRGGDSEGANEADDDCSA